MATTSAQGQLQLAFATNGSSRTDVVERRWCFPLRMTVPLYLDPADRGMAFVYVQNPTGGVFAGDDLTVSVDARAGSRVHLTTQSATKVNRMDKGFARQHIDVRVGDGSYVEYIPDVLIPQGRSRYAQTLRVELGARASFIGTELLAPGRVGHGERFEYSSLRFDTTVVAGDETLMSESLDLVPERRAPASRGLLGGSDYLATLIAVTSLDQPAATLASSLDEALAASSDVRGGAGELPTGSGAMARVLADSAPAARRALDTAWEVARHSLAGLPLPPRRK